jgi:DNA end-binding protein Ku
MIEPSEIANLRVPSKHTIDVAQFVPLSDLAPEYLEKPYFVVPDNDTQAEAFTVVREALAKTKKAGLGKIAFGGREHILAITAAPHDERGMMAYTMRYQEELRKPQEYFSDIKHVKVDEDSLELAESLIKKRTAPFDPAKFKDTYEVALRELVEAKLKHLPIPKDEGPAPHRAKVINLMDALRKSVQGGDTEATHAAGKKKPPSRAASLFPRDEEKAGPTLVKPKATKAAAKSAKGAKRKSA